MKTGKDRCTSYVVNGCLAGTVLFFVLHLSSTGRTVIDYTVIALVLGAIAWNVFKLSQRLHRSEGTKEVWHVQRTVLFWIIGLFNTLLLKAEDAGTWKNWLGWVLLGLAVADTVSLFFKERAVIEESSHADGGPELPRAEADTQE